MLQKSPFCVWESAGSSIHPHHHATTHRHHTSHHVHATMQRRQYTIHVSLVIPRHDRSCETGRHSIARGLLPLCLSHRNPHRSCPAAERHECRAGHAPRRHVATQRTTMPPHRQSRRRPPPPHRPCHTVGARSLVAARRQLTLSSPSAAHTLRCRLAHRHAATPPHRHAATLRPRAGEASVREHVSWEAGHVRRERLTLHRRARCAVPELLDSSPHALPAGTPRRRGQRRGQRREHHGHVQCT